MAHDVFISYSAKDKSVADAITSKLENNEIRCWIAPRDILPGMDWGDAIINAINESRVFVLIFSSNSNESSQVIREVERAVNKGIPIIPFKIEDIDLSKQMEYFLSSTHWLDALTPPLEKHINSLSKTLEFLLDPEKSELKDIPTKKEDYNWWYRRTKLEKISTGLLVVLCLTGAIYLGSNLSNGNLFAQTYGQNGISFQVPDGWEVRSGNISENVTVRGTKETEDKGPIVLGVYKMGGGGTLKYYTTIEEDTASQVGKILSEKPLIIDGENAYNIIYENTVPYGNSSLTIQNSVIFFVKNGIEYKIFFSANNLQSYSSDMDTITKTFHVTS